MGEQNPHSPGAKPREKGLMGPQGWCCSVGSCCLHLELEAPGKQIQDYA